MKQDAQRAHHVACDNGDEMGRRRVIAVVLLRHGHALFDNKHLALERQGGVAKQEKRWHARNGQGVLN